MVNIQKNDRYAFEEKQGHPTFFACHFSLCRWYGSYSNFHAKNAYNDFQNMSALTTISPFSFPWLFTKRCLIHEKIMAQDIEI